MHICLLTVCHVCTGGPDVVAAATVAMPEMACGVRCVAVVLRGAWKSLDVLATSDAEAVRVAFGAYGTCGVGFPAACCLEVGLCAAAVITSGCEISEIGIAVTGGVYVGVVYAATMLCIFLVRSVTYFWSRALSCLSRSTIS